MKTNENNVNVASSTYLVTPEIRFDSKMFFLNLFWKATNLREGRGHEKLFN